KDPFEDRQGFETNLNQLMEKIKHLWKKYIKKDHFRLSKAIGGAEEMAFKSPDDDKLKKRWFQESYLAQSIEILGFDSVEQRQRWNVVPNETKKKIQDKLKLLHVKEVELKKSEEMLERNKRACVYEKNALLNEVISVITEPN
ncbi:hypothetical protein EUTSA_v10023922mg, partial [Eutrema salsugineum]